MVLIKTLIHIGMSLVDDQVVGDIDAFLQLFKERVKDNYLQASMAYFC